MTNHKILVLIPARGGSKGIPHKNIKLMNGKPLITYSIDVARGIVEDVDICVSSDDDEIIKVVKDYGLNVPFKRPLEFATDTATTNDVLLHALDFYESKNIFYDIVVLLQPTSPLRTIQYVKEAIALYCEDIDMVVSVKESHAAAVLCQENTEQYLEPVLNKGVTRRQDMPHYYEYNGAVYVINVNALRQKGLSVFDREVKYLMPANQSIDIDSQFDWDVAEYLLKNKDKYGINNDGKI